MPFLRLTNVGQSIPFLDMNVVDFVEEPFVWLSGDAERSLAGRRLSTERDPRRVFTATVDFRTTPLWEAFRVFVTTQADVLTGRFTAMKTMAMHLTREDGTVLNADVDISFGPARTTPYLTAPNVYAYIWTLDLKLEEA